MKNIHIDNSYTVWSTTTMWEMINTKCGEEYGTIFAEDVLNRSYKSMYVEWYLHNIVYYLTLPFKNNQLLLSYNKRAKDVDLEEH